LFKYRGNIAKTGDKYFYFIVINLILITQFSSHLNESCYTSNVSRATLMKGDRVDNKNSFKNLVMGRPDRRSIYLILCQPVLS